MKPPPTDQPLSLMHVCHSCFLLHSSDGTTLLIDPYFGGPFRWKAHDEKHVEPAPAIKPEEIEKLDGIVITHDHPDHCQPDALYKIMSKHRCGLWGPSGIYRRAVEVGIDNRRVTKTEAFQRFTIGDIQITALPNKGSEDTKPCMRMSYLFAKDDITVFHGGDSHGPSHTWSGHVDGATLALLWPNHIERSVSFVKPFSVALMHCDTFDPGDFLCGYDQGEIRAKLRKKSRGGKVLAPEVGEWFWPEKPTEEELRRLQEKIGSKRRRERGRRDEDDGRGDRPQRGGRKGGRRGRRDERRDRSDSGKKPESPENPEKSEEPKKDVAAPEENASPPPESPAAASDAAGSTGEAPKPPEPQVDQQSTGEAPKPPEPQGDQQGTGEAPRAPEAQGGQQD